MTSIQVWISLLVTILSGVLCSDNKWDEFCSKNYFNYLNQSSNEFNFFRQQNESHFHQWILEYHQTNSTFVFVRHHFVLKENIVIDLSTKDPESNFGILFYDPKDSYWYWITKPWNKIEEKDQGFNYSGIFWYKTKKDIYVIREKRGAPTPQSHQSVFKFEFKELKMVPMNKTVIEFFGCPPLEKESNFWTYMYLAIALVLIFIVMIGISMCIYKMHKKNLSHQTDSSFGPEFPNKPKQKEAETERTQSDDSLKSTKSSNKTKTKTKNKSPKTNKKISLKS